MAHGFGTTNFIRMDKYTRVMGVRPWDLPEQPASEIAPGLGNFKQFKTFQVRETRNVAAGPFYQTTQISWVTPVEIYFGGVGGYFYKEDPTAANALTPVPGAVFITTPNAVSIDSFPGLTNSGVVGGSWFAEPNSYRIDFPLQTTYRDLKWKEFYIPAGVQIVLYAELYETFIATDNALSEITLHFKT